MRQLKVLASIALLFAASAALGYFTKIDRAQTLEHPAGHESPAIWASDAMTPAELVGEADVVIRGQILDQDDTYLVVPEPFRNPETAARLTAQGRVVPQLPFTPSVFEVLEVYSGAVKVGDRIKVLQTGGIVDGQKAELIDDPLYEVGTEHVLFLRNVAGELVADAKGSTFVTINPAGRYKVLGDQLEVQNSFVETDLTAPPLTLSRLEDEIRTAVRSQQGPGLGQN